MKNLETLGFTLDKTMDMFYAKTPSQIKELIGVRIQFSYSDFDNGNISGIGIIKDIREHDVDRDGEGSFSVDFEVESGDNFSRFDYKKDYKFSENTKFYGGIFAGDNTDRVLFKIVE